MIDRARWERINEEAAEKEADKVEAECIEPQLQEGRIKSDRNNRSVVACFCAHSISAEAIAILHKRAKAAGWQTIVDGSTGWFELSKP